MANPLSSGIVPAQLGFLAIYNPSLGTTDETVDDQIVYYASASTLASARRRRHRPVDSISNEERNERLRQIGLAQGMVEFGRSFSGGKAVDSIDTERARVVLHELEPGWWILASIDLTRLPLPPSKTAPTSTPPPAKGTTTSPPPNQPPSPKFEYSSREVKPPPLILQDLLRAHALFLLHHGPSLSSLSSSPPSSTSSSALPRPHFTALLARYWDLFLSTWNVLLHGNPACAVWGGVKVAACGELGIGVGEEDRGSGEREVLEGLVGRVDGLVDLVVGRFGSEQVPAPVGTGKGKGKGVAAGDDEGWLGLGNEVGAEDGAVFLGVGALSRRSLRAVTWWMEDVYTWGESAYGVVGGISGAGSRARRRRGAGRKTVRSQGSPAGGKKNEPAKGKTKPAGSDTSDARTQDRDTQPNTALEDPATGAGEAGGGMDKMFTYLKLGYGTYWSLGTSSPATNSDADDEATPKPTDAEGATSQKSLKNHNAGCFLIGLGEGNSDGEEPGSPAQANRPNPRTVTVELDAEGGHTRESVVGSPNIDSSNQSPRKRNTIQLRPVIYVHRPFIYTLLFQPNTTASPWEELSQSLHTQFTPLHKPLLTSTAYRPEKPNLGIPPTPQSEIYDLVFDPQTLTIHSTIPNIPDPVLVTDSSSGMLAPPPAPAAPWNRVEALNTHTQILSMFAGSLGNLVALERTCKTSRGWWVVWNRVLDQQHAAAAKSSRQSLSLDGSSDDGGGGGEGTAAEVDGNAGAAAGDGYGDGGLAMGKEIFLVRRASDHGGGAGVRGVSASYVGGGASGGWADGASRLAQGIGVDTRRYVEGLLSLNR
ncbi:hypothetical protein C8A01DRAFT_17465 [Parachaetomium inaequale]|uniref:CCZ1/INTU/HSP4 first Longin domain-containing protein n=1 Tax=Parachaetomium inaequale TaxID=2588326 RepID=A0AAN6SQ41_9PEZI|nr:hypothetical protein C8A01DRAFT_17465 [Parachaetomium inaequale]